MNNKPSVLQRSKRLRMRLISHQTQPGRITLPSANATTAMAQKVLTPEQVKQRFKQRGITVTQWAREHGFNRNAVYRVLNGFDKAHYGRAHEIAVALGLKAEAAAA